LLPHFDSIPKIVRGDPHATSLLSLNLRGKYRGVIWRNNHKKPGRASFYYPLFTNAKDIDNGLAHETIIP
jgi:hypothetical protein